MQRRVGPLAVYVERSNEQSTRPYLAPYPVHVLRALPALPNLLVQSVRQFTKAGGLTPWLYFLVRADFPDLMGRAIERRLDQAI